MTNRNHLGFTRKWLETVHKCRKPFDEELLTTTFSKENVGRLLNELKTATNAKIAETQRLVDDDFTYFLQITSQRTPFYPLHLTRL